MRKENYERAGTLEAAGLQERRSIAFSVNRFAKRMMQAFIVMDLEPMVAGEDALVQS